MTSKDRPRTVEELCDSLGVPSIWHDELNLSIAKQRQHAQLEVLDELEAQGHTIAMYPDGNGEYGVVPLSVIEAKRKQIKEGK